MPRGLEGIAERYWRQAVFSGVGREGQERLGRSRALIVGCGAVGGLTAALLARAGVGYLRVVDRDFVERHNLGRQLLAEDADVEGDLPKAEIARRRLRAANPEIEVEAEVADVTADNVVRLVRGMDVIVDGTDNFETRYLLNDAAVREKVPWVYGGAVGAEGAVMAVVPGESPCLRCVFADAPGPAEAPTCETAGVLGGVVAVVAGLQAVAVMKVLMGRGREVAGRLVQVDVWRPRMAVVDARERDPSCACCGQRRFEYLERGGGWQAARLCGQGAVQISAPAGSRVCFAELAARLESAGARRVRWNRFLLRGEVEGYGITVFADGRAIVQGTDEPEVARSVYARYIGA